MDYGTSYREVTGFHGPYNSLEEYKKFYEKNHPIKRKIEAISYLPWNIGKGGKMIMVRWGIL